MFWKIIRWGGTALVVVLVVLGVLNMSDSTDSQAPGQPVQAAPAQGNAPTSKFNF